MIEKWKDEEDFNSILNWCDKVRLAIEKYHTNKGFIDYLSWNTFEDDFNVMVENSELKITLSEETYDTSDMRDSNIEVIKQFVEEELPYYEFYKQTDSPDSEHGFRLIFKLKED
jgi:hypothetical protein